MRAFKAPMLKNHLFFEGVWPTNVKNVVFLGGPVLRMAQNVKKRYVFEGWHALRPEPENHEKLVSKRSRSGLSNLSFRSFSF